MYTLAQSTRDYSSSVHPPGHMTLYYLYNTDKQTDNQVHRTQDDKLKKTGSTMASWSNNVAVEWHE